MIYFIQGVIFALLVLSIYRLLYNVQLYRNLRTLYGEMGTYFIPSVSQAKRIAEIKTAKISSYFYLVAIVVFITLFIFI